MRVASKIRVKDMPQIFQSWRGKTGRIIRIIPAKDDFGTSYEVVIDGIELIFFEFEIEEIKGGDDGGSKESN